MLSSPFAEDLGLNTDDTDFDDAEEMPEDDDGEDEGEDDGEDDDEDDDVDMEESQESESPRSLPDDG